MTITSIQNPSLFYNCAPYQATSPAPSCAICLEPIQQDGLELHPDTRQEDQQPHVFHTQCATRALDPSTAQCPLCRTDVSLLLPHRRPALIHQSPNNRTPSPPHTYTYFGMIFSLHAFKVHTIASLVLITAFSYGYLGGSLFGHFFCVGFLTALHLIPISLCTALIYPDPLFTYEERWTYLSRFAQMYLQCVSSIGIGLTVSYFARMPALVSLTTLREATVLIHSFFISPIVVYLCERRGLPCLLHDFLRELLQITFCIALTYLTICGGTNGRQVLGIAPLGMGSLIGLFLTDHSIRGLIHRLR